jgi:mono/diheme cytochrome c family protein
MRLPLIPALLTITATFVAPGLLAAADATWSQVQTILNDRCIDCHGEKKQKKGLRLDSPEWLMKGSKEGPVFIAGNPDKSDLYTLAALPADDEDRMPPKGKRLTPEQLAVIKSWIAAGAKFDAPAK